MTIYSVYRATDPQRYCLLEVEYSGFPKLRSEDSAPGIFPRGITAPALIRCHVLTADPWCWAVLKRSKRAVSFSPGWGPCNPCMFHQDAAVCRPVRAAMACNPRTDEDYSRNTPMIKGPPIILSAEFIRRDALWSVCCRYWVTDP